MEQLLPPDSGAPDLELLYAAPPGPWLRLGMVGSLDGSAVVGGTSRGLSHAGDRAVFRVLRALADVVLVGAGTARAEAYGPVPLTAERRAARRARGQAEVPPVAVVTRTGLARDSPLAVPGTLLVTTARASVPPGVEAVVAGAEQVDLASALDALRARGLRHVLCEGGPALAGALLAADLVDELCLTVSPHLVGGRGPYVLTSDSELDRRLALAHLLHDDGSLLGRWLVERTTGARRALASLRA